MSTSADHSNESYHYTVCTEIDHLVDSNDMSSDDLFAVKGALAEQALYILHSQAPRGAEPPEPTQVRDLLVWQQDLRDRIANRGTERTVEFNDLTSTLTAHIDVAHLNALRQTEQAERELMSRLLSWTNDPDTVLPDTLEELYTALHDQAKTYPGELRHIMGAIEQIELQIVIHSTQEKREQIQALRAEYYERINNEQRQVNNTD